MKLDELGSSLSSAWAGSRVSQLRECALELNDPVWKTHQSLLHSFCGKESKLSLPACGSEATSLEYSSNQTCGHRSSKAQCGQTSGTGRTLDPLKDTGNPWRGPSAFNGWERGKRSQDVASWMSCLKQPCLTFPCTGMGPSLQREQ